MKVTFRDKNGNRIQAVTRSRYKRPSTTSKSTSRRSPTTKSSYTTRTTRKPHSTRNPYYKPTPPKPKPQSKPTPYAASLKQAKMEDYIKSKGIKIISSSYGTIKYQGPGKLIGVIKYSLK